MIYIFPLYNIILYYIMLCYIIYCIIFFTKCFTVKSYQLVMGVSQPSAVFLQTSMECKWIVLHWDISGGERELYTGT
jgi:hypothetical protein